MVCTAKQTHPRKTGEYADYMHATMGQTSGSRLAREEWRRRDYLVNGETFAVLRSAMGVSHQFVCADMKRRNGLAPNPRTVERWEGAGKYEPVPAYAEEWVTLWWDAYRAVVDRALDYYEAISEQEGREPARVDITVSAIPGMPGATPDMLRAAAGQVAVALQLDPSEIHIPVREDDLPGR